MVKGLARRLERFLGASKLNIKQFLEVVRKSGLVETAQLERLMSESKLPAESQTDVDAIANRLVDSHLVTRWQCDRLLEGRHRGFLLGKYLLLGHLGSGGMSSVYLAEHLLMKRRTAIKVLPKERVEDTSYLDRFYLEARIAAQLDHSNIVRVFDVDHDGPYHFIVMEHIEGQDLQHLVRDHGVLEPVRAADFIRQAALGLAHAHKAGLIHRDIKPANLMVDQHNVVKVLDMGLACFVDDKLASVTIAHDEKILGTADYLAPEQAVNSHQVDARADIYSLGCSLYYLLTGHPPFHQGTLSQRLVAHRRSPPPSIREEQPAVPQDLVDICQRMMAKKRGDRFQSATQVAQALDDWLSARGLLPDPSSSSSSIRLTPMTTVARKTGESSSVLQSPRKSGSSNRVKQPEHSSRVLSSETNSITGEITSKSSDNSRARHAAAAAKSTSKQATPLPAAKPDNTQAFQAFLDAMESRSSTLPEQSARPLKQPYEIPAWLWAAIGAGVLLAIFLLMFAFHM